MRLMSKISKTKYFLGTVLFIVLAASFIKSSFDVLKSKDRLDEIDQEITLLEQKKTEIEKEIEYKQTPEYIEQKARNDLNLIRSGEKVYVVVGDDDQKETYKNVLSESDEREKDEKKEKNWYSWYRLFFDE